MSYYSLDLHKRHTVCTKLTFFFKTDGCSKLTTSLVNELLKFQMLISQIRQYLNFSHFCNKNISVFGYKVAKHLTS